MKYIIRGADRETGEERELRLTATSRETACRQANHNGIVVSDVEELKEVTTPSHTVAPMGSHRSVRCPDCGNLLAVRSDSPDATCNRCGTSFMLSAPPIPARHPAKPPTKVCPYCAETIPAASVRCHFCGESLTRSQNSVDRALTAQAEGTGGTKKAGFLLCSATASVILFLITLVIGAAKRESNDAWALILFVAVFVGLVIGPFVGWVFWGSVGKGSIRGSQWSGATLPGAATDGSPKSNARSILTGIIGLALFIGIAVFNSNKSASKPPQQVGNDEAPAEQTCSWCFADFDSRFSAQSTRTELQKKRDIESVKGQRVRWRGIVSYVSEGSVGFLHKATTNTYDVLLTVAKSEKPKLVTLNEGDMIEYDGVIKDYGDLFYHDLEDGHIRSHHRTNNDERAKFLMETETAVLTQVRDQAGP